jgi:hypothetical protein
MSATSSGRSKKKRKKPLQNSSALQGLLSFAGLFRSTKKPPEFYKPFAIHQPAAKTPEVCVQ